MSKKIISVCEANQSFHYIGTIIYKNFRKADLTHSLADIAKSKIKLRYCPTDGAGKAFIKRNNGYANEKCFV